MILKINIMEKVNEIKLPKGVDSISVTQHDDKIVIEFIPKKRKFKAGDKVRIKDGISSKTHKEVNPCFNSAMDEFIGKKLTVKGYSNDGYVLFNDDYLGYHFAEDWLKPCSDEPKKGDWAIFWDNKYLMPLMPLISLYYGKTGSGNSHIDNFGTPWDNAVKWDGTKEQFEKILRGEI